MNRHRRRTLLSKALYRLGGLLSHIRTYQRYYVFAGDTFDLQPGGWHWYSCGLSTRLECWSMQLDPHWDHWALIHDTCDPQPCSGCGGCRCDLWGTT